MTKNVSRIEIDVEADARADAEALAGAVEEARADPRFVPHADMRAWLLRVADGEFDAPPPELHSS
jgi:Fe-S-cluster formation regulator IscX/YfhJ